MKVAVVGCGYWGKNHIRVLKELGHEVVCIDINDNLNKALYDNDIFAVFICTPADTHYNIAKRSLINGKHTFVEKPLCLDIKESVDLHRLARINKVTLFTGYTYRFNSYINWAKEAINKGDIGNILYAHSERTNNGRIIENVNVVQDLAPHDISIFNYLLGKTPDHSSFTATNLNNKQSCIAFISLFYGKVLVNIHVGWVDPRKVRNITIVGDRGSIVIDEMGENKVTVYKEDGAYVPQIRFLEPLKLQDSEFIRRCIAKEMSDDLEVSFVLESLMVPNQKTQISYLSNE